MGSVNVSIAGKTFRMACEDGEEDHLRSLGQDINASIEELRGQFGEIGDQRLIVMAAIMIADRNAENEQKIQKLEDEISGLNDARASLVERQEKAEADIAQVMDQLADRLDAMAGRLSGTHPLANGG